MIAASALYMAMYSELHAGGAAPTVEFVGGGGVVPSAFGATDFAAAATALPAAAISDLLAGAGHGRPTIRVDRMLASAWFAASLRPEGWTPPPAWDPIAGDYETSDGWVRLHTNAERHRAAALKVLGCGPKREEVARVLLGERAIEVESAIVAAGGCAAQLHTVATWRSHPQGIAVANEPLCGFERTPSAGHSTWVPQRARPLEGVRVLDLTRVLAGPTATRLLAGYGASVLRIDPPQWDESIACEVTLGKRCARVDAKSPDGRGLLRDLLQDADVLVHGYRPGALEELGLGVSDREAIRPGLIDVSLDAYGWSGPWKERRGFDSLVQMSTGIADHGRKWSGQRQPHPLPFQALDQATGHLMAAQVIDGLLRRRETGEGTRARCSLARTAHFLIEHCSSPVEGEPFDVADVVTSEAIEETSWGPARRVGAPIVISDAVMRWDLPASELGSSPPTWAPFSQ